MTPSDIKTAALEASKRRLETPCPLAVRGKMAELRALVDVEIANAGYWKRHGKDLAHSATVIVISFTLGLLWMSSDSPPAVFAGCLAAGFGFMTIQAKATHLFAHNSLFETKIYNKLGLYVAELFGPGGIALALNMHIKEHHPYTNIIGMGDSETWKFPSLSRHLYFFIAPMLLPTLGFPYVMFLLRRRVVALVLTTGAGILGLYLQCQTVVYICGYSSSTALALVYLSKSLFQPFYLHFNIFQHIGMPMFSMDTKPPRLYQMALGVLNLDSNVILNTCMGHSLISCHVEHHLFPGLSDNMCLQISPVVRKYFSRHGIVYNKDSYTNRLAYFYSNYDKLMLQLPSISNFVITMMS